MKRFPLMAAVLLAALGALAPGAAQAAGLERLYILNCGEGVAGDISRWSPGVNVGQSMPFVDNCYLLKHTQGWLLWDTGVPDAIAAMPDGQKPADPKATHWYRPQRLASQLEALGVKPADITFVAVSHTHGDHSRVPVNNVDPEQTKASMERIAGILVKEKATLWINHDKAQRDTLTIAPSFYE